MASPINNTEKLENKIAHILHFFESKQNGFYETQHKILLACREAGLKFEVFLRGKAKLHSPQSDRKTAIGRIAYEEIELEE